MKIVKALKIKNKLVKEINQIYSRLASNVSHIKGQKPSYSVEELLSELDVKLTELAELKTKIHKANAPVYDKIFTLGELKNKVEKLKSLKLESGVRNNWGGSVEYEAQVDQKFVDDIVAEIETKIEQVQDELDFFNATTEI